VIIPPLPPKRHLPQEGIFLVLLPPLPLRGISPRGEKKLRLNFIIVESRYFSPLGGN